MSGAHTPGPWVVMQSSICTDDGKANEIAKVTRYGVWMGDGAPYGSRNPIGEANARLIAAAPDMLWAIEVALEMLIDSWGDEQIAAGDDQVANLLRAAIAKAKGE